MRIFCHVYSQEQKEREINLKELKAVVAVVVAVNYRTGPRRTRRGNV